MVLKEHDMTRMMCKQIIGFGKKKLNENKVEFSTDDELISGFITDISKQIGSVNAAFDSLSYDETNQRVQWSGKIAGEVSWAVIYSNNEDNGVYYTVDNAKLSSNVTRALHKLNLYFETVWFSAIRDAILRKELTKTDK